MRKVKVRTVREYVNGAPVYKVQYEGLFHGIFQFWDRSDGAYPLALVERPDGTIAEEEISSLLFEPLTDNKDSDIPLRRLINEVIVDAFKHP